MRSRHHHRRSHHHYAHHAKETSATEVEKAIPTSSIPTSSIHTNVTSVKVMPLTEGKGLSIYYISNRGRSGLLVRSWSVRWSSSVLKDFNLLGPLAHEFQENHSLTRHSYIFNLFQHELCEGLWYVRTGP